MRLALALLVLGSAAQAQTPGCADPQTQIEMNACAEREWQAADRALNEAYGQARAAMRRLDADFPQEARGAEAALREAQRAWITFRDAACAVEGWPMRGGSAELLLIHGCLARLTRQRTEDLLGLAAY